MHWLLYLLSLLSGYFFKALGAFLVLNCIDKSVSWYFSPLWRIPGPKGQSFLFGSFPSIRNEPFMEPAKRWWKEAGFDAKLLHYTQLFGRPNIIVLDKAIVKEILTAPSGRNDARFVKRYEIVRELVGTGLITLEGEDWMRHRRIIQPSFSGPYLRDMLNKVVPPKANRLVEFWKESEGREIDVASHVSAVTLDVIGEVAFSHSFHGMEEIAKWVKDEGSTKLAELQDPFISAILESFNPNLMTIILNLFGMISLDSKLNPKSRKYSKLLYKAAHEVVTNAAKNPEPNKSLLQLMLNAEDPDSTSARKLNHSELIDETKTFLVAGHETTSTWCYWALYALARHPDIQEKVFCDIEKHCKNGSDPITSEMVNEMEYFHAFLQEVLRLYTPVGLIVRQNVRAERLGGYEIPKDTRITIPIHLLHRHPHYWEEPESFKPERWQNMDEERIRFAFLPFSAGGRNCIGQRFATIEARLILSPLVRKFRFQVAPSQRDTIFTFTNFVTMKSKPALKMVVQSRK